MITTIRDYIKGVIQEIDSDLKQHDEYFDVDNIPDTKLEDTYLLQFGSFSSTRVNTSYQAVLPVTISFWKNGGTDTINKMDMSFCNAIEMMREMQDQTRIDQADWIKSVVGVAITPQPSDNNENLARFDLEINVITTYN